MGGGKKKRNCPWPGQEGTCRALLEYRFPSTHNPQKDRKKTKKKKGLNRGKKETAAFGGQGVGGVFPGRRERVSGNQPTVVKRKEKKKKPH